jgi:MFS family permease
MDRKSLYSNALKFVILIGIVNLFADMTYEGGGAINGQFLAILGASAAAVSIAAGLGEFLGYALRSVSGYFADRTGKYWPITFFGYALNLFAVPAMALAGNWKIAVLFILLERTGRAIRKPTTDAMISYTTGTIGKGWAYAVNTALDEAGATIGPLIAALVLFLHGSYQNAYEFLLISAVLALGTLSFARITFPVPSKLEQGPAATEKGFSRAYWLYTIAGALFAAGIMSYELISFHLATEHIVGIEWIPILLAFSTGCGVIANLALGRLYDRSALPTVLVSVALSSLFAPLVFAGGFLTLILAMVVWGIAYAVQDTLLKAIVAGVLPAGRRNLAFGLFYAFYGGGWLLGSVAMGLLYSYSLPLLIAFTIAMPLVSLPFFFAARKAQA